MSPLVSLHYSLLLLSFEPQFERADVVVAAARVNRPGNSLNLVLDLEQLNGHSSPLELDQLSC